MKQLREALLLMWWSTGVQDQSIRRTVFPLRNSRRWCSVWWSRRNRFAKWQPRTVSRLKRSVAFFFRRRSRMDSKKR